MAYYLMTIEYDGTDFHGWQRQPEARTVQGEIEAALSEICRKKIEIHGVSRTDAGVHAYGQRAGFSTDVPIPADRLKLALNNVLSGSKSRGGRCGDIRIRSVVIAEEGFHARYDAVGKKYIYRILSAEEPDIFLRNAYWQIIGKPDPVAMKRAAEYMVGTHDFKSFQSAGGSEPESTVKTIYGLSVRQECLGGKAGLLGYGSGDRKCSTGDVSGSLTLTKADVGGSKVYTRDVSESLGDEKVEDESNILTTLEITGSGFLYNMVRIITGTLLLVGEGKRDADSIPHIIESRNRDLAGSTAPPQGLYLAEVYYDADDMRKGAARQFSAYS